MHLPVILDPKSKTPLFLQLSRALRERILSGNLSAGSALPSTREMGESLGLARATVVKAYEDLISQGFLSATPGGGTYVSRRGQSERRDTVESPHDRALAAATARKLSSEARRLMELSFGRATSADMPELNYGSAPVDLLPARQWKEVLISHCRMQDPHKLDYTPETFGHYPLRAAIASYLGRSKAINCEPEQIVVFSGSQQALYYIAHLLLDPLNHVALENPGYAGARNSFAAQGAALHAVGIDDNGMQVSELKNIAEPIKLVYTTPSHHDPTGAIMSIGRRNELLTWASMHDVFVVEDAWDSDYIYVNPPLPSLQGMDRDGRVIYIYSFWKVMYPLVTIGCLVLPLTLVPIFERAKTLIERQFPLLEHYALTDFITEGYYERHIKKTRSLYGKRRQALLSALAENFRSGISIPKQSAGLHLCVRFEPEFAEPDLIASGKEEGIPLISTRSYYLDNFTAGEFLIPFAGLPESEISRRVARVASRLASLPRQHS